MDDNEQLLRIRMTHTEAHPSFPASFRRPPNTSEFKLEPAQKSSVPQMFPAMPPPPPPPPQQVMADPGSSVVPAVVLVEEPQPEPERVPIDNGLHPEELLNPRPPVCSVPYLNHAALISVIQPVLYFSPAQLEGLKRKFDALVTAAAGPVPPQLAHALGSVFDHIERSATELDMDRYTKRQRTS